jgi:hypothetical protein
LVPSTQTYTLPSGQTCTVSIDKEIETLYDYEHELNESRRNIKILNSVFLKQMEQSFVQIMGS